MAMFTALFSYSQTTVILAQWSFPLADSTSLLPDSSVSSNATKYISAEDTVAYPNTNMREVTFTNGITTYAGTADGWHNGNGAKLWSIKIKTNSLKNITVSSKQRSGNTNPGPKYWKIQARISGQPWVDLPGGNVVCGNDWTTGVVNDIPLGTDFDSVSASIFVRWIMTSDSSITGTIVDSLGISKIDDVIIKGVQSTTGIEETLFNSAFSFYPNPSMGMLTIESTKGIRALNVYNNQGQIVRRVDHILHLQTIDMNGLTKGLYFLQPEYNDNSIGTPQKLMME